MNYNNPKVGDTCLVLEGVLETRYIKNGATYVGTVFVDEETTLLDVLMHDNSISPCWNPSEVKPIGRLIVKKIK